MATNPDWKNSLYQQYQEPITNMYNQQKSMLDNIYNQQRESQLSQLQAQRDRAIGQINQQKSQAAPQYQQARNQTDAVNLQNVQRLREVMANAGLTSSGENISANVAMNNQRQSNLNSINLQERHTMDDYDRRITDLNNPAEEEALLAAIESERAKALYGAYNNSQQFGYQQVRDSIGDQRYDQQFNYQQQRDKIGDDRYKQEFDYNKSIDSRNFNFQQQQAQAEKAWREYTFKNMSASEKAQLEWAKSQYGEDAAWRMYQMQYQGNLQQSMNQAQINSYTSGFPGLQGGVDIPTTTKRNQLATLIP